MGKGVSECASQSRVISKTFLWWGARTCPPPPSPLPHNTTSVEFADFVELYLSAVSFQQQITFKLGTSTNFEAFCLALLADCR